MCFSIAGSQVYWLVPTICQTICLYIWSRILETKILVPHFTYYFNITILIIELLFYYYITPFTTTMVVDATSLIAIFFFFHIKYHIATEPLYTLNFNICCISGAKWHYFIIGRYTVIEIRNTKLRCTHVWYIWEVFFFCSYHTFL